MNVGASVLRPCCQHYKVCEQEHLKYTCHQSELARYAKQATGKHWGRKARACMMYAEYDGHRPRSSNAKVHYSKLGVSQMMQENGHPSNPSREACIPIPTDAATQMDPAMYYVCDRLKFVCVKRLDNSGQCSPEPTTRSKSWCLFC